LIFWRQMTIPSGPPSAVILFPFHSIPILIMQYPLGTRKLHLSHLEAPPPLHSETGLTINYKWCQVLVRDLATPPPPDTSEASWVQVPHRAPVSLVTRRSAFRALGQAMIYYHSCSFHWCPCRCLLLGLPSKLSQNAASQKQNKIFQRD